jgi:hypothetical protein
VTHLTQDPRGAFESGLSRKGGVVKLSKGRSPVHSHTSPIRVKGNDTRLGQPASAVRTCSVNGPHAIRGEPKGSDSHVVDQEQLDPFRPTGRGRCRCEQQKGPCRGTSRRRRQGPTHQTIGRRPDVRKANRRLRASSRCHPDGQLPGVAHPGAVAGPHAQRVATSGGQDRRGAPDV